MSFRLRDIAHKAPGLTASERMVLGAICFYAPNDQGTDVTRPVDDFAAQAGMSVRQTQRIMRKLEGEREDREGWIICEREASGHRPAKWSINLKRLGDGKLREVSGCHPSKAQRCQDVTSRGDTAVTSRGDTAVTPIRKTGNKTGKDLSSARENAPFPREEFQPSLKLPIPGGRDVLPQIGDDAGSWSAVWAEFSAWPHPHPNASEPLARAAWARVAPLVGEARLRACIRAHGETLAAGNENRPKGSPVLAACPHNWLERHKGYERYLSLEAGVQTASAYMEPELLERLLRAGLDAGRLHAFAGAEVIDETATLRARSEVVAAYIARDCAPAVARLFGRRFEEVTIAWRRENAA